jgi:hypothetical protein
MTDLNVADEDEALAVAFTGIGAMGEETLSLTFTFERPRSASGSGVKSPWTLDSAALMNDEGGSELRSDVPSPSSICADLAGSGITV